MFDEWITIQKEYYWRGPAWLRADDARDQRPVRFFLVDQYVEIMSSANPINARRYQYQDSSYLLVEYDVQELPGGCSEVAPPQMERPFHVSIWVDSSTELLAKAVVASKDQRSIEQVFTAYNEEIVVTQPHIGMEPSHDKPGSYVVTDNRQFPVPFHQ